MSTAERIPTEGVTSVRVTARSGAVNVSAVGDGAIEVSPGALVSRDEDGALVLTSAYGGSSRINLRVPSGTDIVIGTASGRIRVRGTPGAVSVSSESGGIEVESAAMLDARAFSGSVKVGYCADACRVQTRSGEARVTRVDGPAELATESGRVIVSETHGDLRVRTSHGRVDVTAGEAVNVAVQTMSGRVRVTFPSNTRPRTLFRSRSGAMSTDLAEGDDCRVAVQTLSGALEVVSA